MHELTHNRFGDHDEKFWALFRVLMRESKDLDWSQGTAHRSGEAAAAAAGTSALATETTSMELEAATKFMLLPWRQWE